MKNLAKNASKKFLKKRNSKPDIQMNTQGPYEFAPAIEVLAEGRELFEKVGDVQGTLRARLNQARAIGRSGDNRLALESAQEVEKTAREARATPIVIDDDSGIFLKETHETQPLGPQTLKGFARPIEAFLVHSSSS